MARIAVGGWHHETNTFAPTKADYDAFERADGWPGLSRGPVMVEAVKGINIPVAGFLDAMSRHEIAPLLWCSATPSAHVTKDAYERIAAMIVEDVRRALPLDALYLDLHGAMVTEHLEDGEGELLDRIRRVVGAELPIVVSLDFHANVTPAMVGAATALVVYRTYPHVDMAETGQRSAALLERILKDPGVARHKAYRQINYLVPLTWQCTMIEPAQSLYATLPDLERDGIASVSVAMGFPLADIHDCGATVLAYGESAEAAKRMADRLQAMVDARESGFAGKLWEPREAVRHAMGLAKRGARG
ncbi:MAG: M81 family metallopeptidase, partial [Alphaproteobacteria bacterium]